MTIRTIIVAAVASLSFAGTGFGQVTFEFTNSGQTLGNNNTQSVALGDLDGDGDLDALIVNAVQDNTVWINNGNGIFTNLGEETPAPLMSSESVALGDLDGDGDLDAMFANDGGDAASAANVVWINNGDATFTNPGQALGQGRSLSVAFGDLDGDSDLDAMVANFNEPNTVWTNDGNGTFTNSGQALGNNNSRTVALGDLDGDGDIDAVVANNSQPYAVWTNNGKGTFTNSHNFNYGINNNTGVALGDFDGDGDLDAMAAAGTGTLSNTVWTNDGTGNFTDSGQTLGNNDSTSIALGDIDGDGAIDAMVANYEQPNTVWINDGTGTFTNSGQALGNALSISVALGDLDGDGAIDAMVANRDQPSTVWNNTVTGAGVCCSLSGCAISTENLAGYCELLGGIYLPTGSCNDCPDSCAGDTNGDGVINIADLLTVIDHWGVCP